MSSLRIYLMQSFLAESRSLSWTFHNNDNVHLFQMLGILLDKSRSPKEAREKTIEYAKEHDVSKSVVMAVSGVANCKIDYDSLNRKGGGKMYAVFEEVAREGREEGERIGMAKGIVVAGLEVGLSENDILAMLQRKLDMSEDMACEYFEMFSK